MINKEIQSKTSEFIVKAIKTHGNKYDYSNVKYRGSHAKVSIICPEHGEFEQSPSNHLSGKECLKCSYFKRAQKMTKGIDVFVKNAINVHGNKYDYSKSNMKIQKQRSVLSAMQRMK